MRRPEIKNLVTATLSSHLHREEQGISETSDLFEELGADSLDVVELTLEFEEMFQVDISDDDLEQIQTVGQIVDLLEKKVSTSMVEEQDGRPGQEDDAPVQQPVTDEPEVEGDEADGDGEAESDESGEDPEEE